MPTSMTVAPGRTMSAVTKSARPMAAIRMSACRVIAPRSRVRLWQTVTVASRPRRSSSDAIGLPTMLLRPITTACAPAVSMPDRTSISTMPAGVHGSSVSSPSTRRPTFSG